MKTTNSNNNKKTYSRKIIQNRVNKMADPLFTVSDLEQTKEWINDSGLIPDYHMVTFDKFRSISQDISNTLWATARIKFSRRPYTMREMFDNPIYYSYPATQLNHLGRYEVVSSWRLAIPTKSAPVSMLLKAFAILASQAERLIETIARPNSLSAMRSDMWETWFEMSRWLQDNAVILPVSSGSIEDLPSTTNWDFRFAEMVVLSENVSRALSSLPLLDHHYEIITATLKRILMILADFRMRTRYEDEATLMHSSACIAQTNLLRAKITSKFEYILSVVRRSK